MPDKDLNLAAVLAIPAGMEQDLRNIDALLASMEAHVTQMAAGFTSMKTGFDTVLNKASQFKQNITATFDEKGVMRSFKAVSDAVEKMNQMGASGKSGFATNEERLNTRLERIWRQRADTYASIQQRIQQLQEYMSRVDQLELSKKATGGQLDDRTINNYIKASKYVDELRDRVRLLNMEFDKGRAGNSVQNAIGLDERTVEQAKEKLDSLKEARRQVMLPGGADDAASQNTWLVELDRQIDRVTAKLQHLNNQKKADAATASLNEGLNTDYTNGTFEERINRAREALNSFKDAYRQMVSQQKAGNPLITQAEVDEARRNVEKVKKDLVDLRKLKKQDKEYFKAFEMLFLASDREANSIDSLKVKLKEYERALTRLRILQASGNAFVSQDDIDMAKKGIEYTKAKIDELRGKLATTNRYFDRMSQSASMLQSRLQMAFGIYGISRFVRELVRVRSEFSKLERSLAVLVQSDAEGAKIFKQVQQIAIKSPYEIKDIAGQVRQIAAYGIETDKLIEKTKMLGDIASGTGVELNRLALAYGQIRAATVLKGQEARQLTEAGVDIFNALAKYYSEMYQRGVSAAEVMDMMRRKMISFEDVDAVLQKMTNVGGKFYKMQEKQAETIGGMISNMKDRASIMFNELGTDTEGFMKNVVQLTISVLSNAKAIKYLFTLFASYQLMNGVISLFGNMTIGAIKGVKAIGQLTKGVRGLALATRLVNFGAMIAGALVGIISLFAAWRREVNKLDRELKKVKNDTLTDADNQERAYRSMIATLEDETTTIAEKQKILEKLKGTYGSVLPIEKYRLDNIKELTQNTEAYVRVLKESIYEEGRKRQVEMALKSDNYTDAREAFVKSMKTAMAENTILPKDLFSQTDLEQAFVQSFDKFVETGDATILEIDSIIGRLLKYKGISEDVQTSFLDWFDQEWRGSVMGLNTQVNDFKSNVYAVEKSLDEIFKNKDYVINIDENFEVENIRKRFKEIKNAFDDVVTAKGSEGQKDEQGNIIDQIIGNDAAIREKAREAATRVYQNISEEIANTTFSTDPKANKVFADAASAELESYFFNQVGDAVTQSVDKVFEKINKDFEGKEDLGFDVGSSGVTHKAGNKSWEDYIKDLKNYVKETKFYTGELSKIQSIRDKGTQAQAQRLISELGFEQKNSELLKQKFTNLWTEQEYWSQTMTMITTQIIPAANLRAEQVEKLIESLGDIFQKNTNNKGGRSIKDELNDLIRALREAAKEWEHLDQTGKNVLSEQIKIKAGRLKITTPEQFDTTSLMQVVNNLLKDPRMKRDDVLSITLDINKDQLKESFDDIKEKIEGLWKDYDMAKQMKDFGIVFEGFSMEDVMAKLSEEEAKLRKKGNDENLADAIKAADEIAKKRLDILRKEREEALKLMHDSERKAQDKTIQIYQDAYEKIGKIISGANKGAKEGQMVSEEEIQKSVNAVLAKSYEDVAKAQWDAYKSTDMYIAAFGDLDTTSSEVLTSIYNQLERFAKMQGLNPADAKAIAQAKAKIEQQMYLRPGEGVNNYWKLMKEDMGRYYEARKDYNDNIDKYRSDYVQATDDYETARKASELADKEYAEALAGQNQAQNLKDKADAAVRDAQEKLNTQKEIVAQATRDVANATADASLKTGTKAEKQARQDALTAAKKTLVDAQEEEVRLQKELDAANKNVADTDNALIVATNEVSKKYEEQTDKANAVKTAEDKMNETGKKVIDTEKRKKLALNATKTHLDKLISAYDAVANEVTGSISLAKDFAEAMGLALGDDANEAIDAFTSSFGMMSQALSLASGAMAIFTAMEEAATAAGMTLQTVLWPLLIITAVIGAISAIIKAADNAKVKQIEQHKETVDKLKKSFDDLKDSFEEVMSMKAAADNFDKQLRNLQQQREELEQIIALEESRGVKKDEEALKGYIDDLHDLDKAEKDANKSKLDLLNVPSNYQDVAKDFASSWLDAFKDTGKGLKSLKESFDSLYEDMVVGQLQFKVMGPALEKIQKMMTDAAEDMDITPSEAASIRKEWEESRAYVNKTMTEWARAYGIAVSDSLATDTLQRGIQSLTEDTGQVIESYLNSIRFIVSDSNLTHKEVLDILRGTGGMENPMLSELKAQTTMMQDIRDAILSVTRSGHTKGGNGLKVFLD